MCFSIIGVTEEPVKVASKARYWCIEDHTLLSDFIFMSQFTLLLTEKSALNDRERERRLFGTD